jgi:hypothetical protein
MGLKAPRGMGMLTNPKKALYNKVYNKTSVSVDRLFKPSKTHSSSSVIPSGKTNGSFWINLVIFLVLTAIFFPLGIGFLVYQIYKSMKKQPIQQDATDIGVTVLEDNSAQSKE